MRRDGAAYQTVTDPSADTAALAPPPRLPPSATVASTYSPRSPSPFPPATAFALHPFRPPAHLQVLPLSNRLPDAPILHRREPFTTLRGPDRSRLAPARPRRSGGIYYFSSLTNERRVPMFGCSKM